MGKGSIPHILSGITFLTGIISSIRIAASSSQRADRMAAVTMAGGELEPALRLPDHGRPDTPKQSAAQAADENRHVSGYP